jgi:hypothetical protein
MNRRVKKTKKRISREILYFRFRDMKFSFIEAQFSATEMALAPMTVIAVAAPILFLGCA